MIVHLILTEFEESIEGITPATDAGAPSTFKALGSADELTEAGQDRNFIVVPTESDPDGTRDVTNLAVTNTVDEYVRVTVTVKYTNEARDWRTFWGIVMQDRKRIRNVVEQDVRAGSYSGGSVGECLCELGSGSLRHDNATPRVVYSEMTFRVEYRDAIFNG